MICAFLSSSHFSEQPAQSQDITQPGAVWNQVDNYLSEVTKNGAMRWPAVAMPLHVFINSGSTTDGYRPEFTKMLEQSFSEWAVASENRVSFLLTNDTNKAQITCHWTSNPKEMTTLTEGGHALIIPDDHNIKLVHITFLTKTLDSQKLSDEYFKRLALHEIGHALGLVHSPSAGDIMFGSVASPVPCATLTNRDKNTLVALYSIDKSKVNNTTFNVNNMLPEKTNQSDLARIIRLNAEAAEAMKKKDLSAAVAKLEQAHQIDKNNDLINGNLGAAYGNCAMVACLMQDSKRAQAYFDKALPLLSKSSNKDGYLSVLKVYENYLLNNKRDVEATKIANRIKTLTH